MCYVDIPESCIIVYENIDHNNIMVYFTSFVYGNISKVHLLGVLIDNQRVDELKII